MGTHGNNGRRDVSGGGGGGGGGATGATLQTPALQNSWTVSAPSHYRPGSGTSNAPGRTSHKPATDQTRQISRNHQTRPGLQRNLTQTDRSVLTPTPPPTCTPSCAYTHTGMRMQLGGRGDEPCLLFRAPTWRISRAAGGHTYTSQSRTWPRA